MPNYSNPFSVCTDRLFVTPPVHFDIQHLAPDEIKLAEAAKNSLAAYNASQNNVDEFCSDDFGSAAAVKLGDSFS